MSMDLVFQTEKSSSAHEKMQNIKIGHESFYDVNHREECLVTSKCVGEQTQFSYDRPPVAP